MKLIYKIKTSTEKDIYMHLNECNDYFIPPLNQRVNLEEFSKKIFEKAITFEAWDNQNLVGIVCSYFNDREMIYGYINHVSVINDLAGNGIATTLLKMCIEYASTNNFKEINLEVSSENKRAIYLYEKLGFCTYDKKEHFLLMKYKIC